MPRPPRAHLEEVDLEDWQRANSSVVSFLTGGEETGVRSLLAQPEGKTLEFKRDLSSLVPVLKTLTAFANTAGGTLIVGRTSDGRLHGVPDIGKAEERLANAVADGIAPVLLPDIEAVHLDGADLLVVRVTRWPFLEALRSGGKLRAKDIAAHFGVAAKTAKRDVAALRDQGLVEFEGAPKNGYYRLSED